MHKNDLLPIGRLAERTGISVSALRFYETRGLLQPTRNSGGQRRYLRSDIRRVSFVLIAQQMGFSISEIGDQLAALPEGRTPTQRDWQKMSQVFSKALEAQIAGLEQTRERLNGCIGCGCLSLQRCALYNPEDRAAKLGAGPRYLMGDDPDRVNRQGSE